MVAATGCLTQRRRAYMGLVHHGTQPQGQRGAKRTLADIPLKKEGTAHAHEGITPHSGTQAQDRRGLGWLSKGWACDSMENYICLRHEHGESRGRGREKEEREKTKGGEREGRGALSCRMQGHASFSAQ